MRRVRTALISIMILALIAAGGSYAARRAALSSSGRTVEVTSVSNVNDFSGFMEYDSMEGVIISKDTQTVYRNSGYSLKKVYVSEGDKVSKGDKLLEYDMEKVELEAEKAGLDKWGLELELESMNKQLELLKRGIVPVDDESSYRYSDRTSSTSSDDADDSDDGDDYYGDDGGADYDDDEDYIDLTMSADILEDGGLVQAQEDDGIAEDFEDDPEVEEYGIIEDDEELFIIDEDNGSDIAPYTGGQDTDLSPMQQEDPELNLIRSVNEFLNAVNAITEVANGSLSALGNEEQAEMIESALASFRSRFGEKTSTTQTNLLGESVTVTDYVVSDSVTSIVGETTTHVMQTAYDRLCAYQFVSVMERLNPDGKSSSSENTDSARNKEDLLRTAADLLVSLPPTVFNEGKELFNTEYDALNNKWTGDGKESRVEYLKGLAELFNGSTIVEQQTDIPDTVSTEGISPSDSGEPADYDDDDFGDEGEDVNFPELIKQMEDAIFEEKLLIREAELEIKEYDEKLNGKIVYAILDGVVMSADGSDSGSRSSSPIMVVTGKKGLYVRGMVKENSLDTVKVGDIVYGSTYGSSSFTAEIVEISPYPETGSNNYYYYGFGDSNSNESDYPFLAFIENTEGLEVDDGVELSLNGEISEYGYSMEDGLALNSAFIRTEEGGRSYCLVEGEDGRLEKRYVKVGSNDWGTITIESGLSRSDYIAFPYGKGVEEGARTTRVETLKALDYDLDY